MIDLNAERLARRIGRLALEKKAEAIYVLDLRGLTSITDYFVICSGASDTHVRAIVDHISEELRKQRVRPSHLEGYSHLRWVLLDYYDVVVHVFQPETREYYGLERLWGDAEMEIIEEEVNE